MYTECHDSYHDSCGIHEIFLQTTRHDFSCTHDTKYICIEVFSFRDDYYVVIILYVILESEFFDTSTCRQVVSRHEEKVELRSVPVLWSIVVISSTLK